MENVLNVQVSAKAEYSAMSPSAGLHFHVGNGGGTTGTDSNIGSGYSHCFVTLGTPTISTSGDTITISIPEEIRAVSRLEPSTYGTQYGKAVNRNIVVIFTM